MTASTPQLWKGTSLSDDKVALVVFAAGGETAGTAPKQVIAAATNGHNAPVVVPVAQMADFLKVHARAHLVCHDAGQLHLVLSQDPVVAADAGALQALRGFVRDGRLYDVMLLDQLVRLAQPGRDRARARTLPELAAQYARVTLADPARVQAIIPALPPTAPAHADQDLAAEAVQQAWALWMAFDALWEQAQDIATATGAPTRFGPLSLALQVRGAVALAHAQQNGLRLAPQAYQSIAGRCLQAQRKAVAALLADVEARRCFYTRPSTAGAGEEIELTTKGSPLVHPTQLERWLRIRSDAITGLHLTDLTRPVRLDRWLSQKPGEWGRLVNFDPLLQAWADLWAAPAVTRSCLSASSSMLRPHYEVLPGIQSRDPDLDALRRLAGPGLFRPAPGHWFLVVELQELDLRALAAVCRCRFGRSRLADLFSAGKSPYDRAAAELAGCTPTTFEALKQSEPEVHDRWLRIARALLKSAPLGLSVERIREIARGEEFGLDDLGLAELATWHGRLLKQIFPELEEYLADNTLVILGRKLGYDRDQLERRLKSSFGNMPSSHHLRHWFRGDRSLSRCIEQRVWALLETSPNREQFAEYTTARERNRELYADLFSWGVTTPTGRVRGQLLFADAAQAEYLDVADDAVKAGGFALAEAGYRLVAVAGCTIVLEVAGPGTSEVLTRAQALVSDAVKDVLPGIPAGCIARWSDQW
jgi:hypothetical protein